MEKLRADWSSTVADSSKDPTVPHRNELPDHRELLHVAPPPPQPFLTIEDLAELNRREAAKAAAKAQETEATKPLTSTAENAEGNSKGA